MSNPFRDREEEDYWDNSRNNEWENSKDELDMDRGEWEYQKNVDDYGLTNEDLDSGDQD